MARTKSSSLVPSERVERSILTIRGHHVMLDADLAELYGVTTKRFNEQVKRNSDRFPEDFMFRLNRREVEQLNRSQFATGSQKHRDPRYPPYAFTEHGTVMLANILKSKTAVQTSIQVVRAFVRLRQVLSSNAALARKLNALEKKHDDRFKVVFEAIDRLMRPPDPKQRAIGFRPKRQK